MVLQVQPHESPEGDAVPQGLFHLRVGEDVPLLQQQHLYQHQGRIAGPAFRRPVDASCTNRRKPSQSTVRSMRSSSRSGPSSLTHKHPLMKAGPRCIAVPSPPFCLPLDSQANPAVMQRSPKAGMTGQADGSGPRRVSMLVTGMTDGCAGWFMAN